MVAELPALYPVMQWCRKTYRFKCLSLSAILFLQLLSLQCCNSADCVASWGLGLPVSDSVWNGNGLHSKPQHMHLDHDARVVRDCFYCRSNCVEKGLAAKDSNGAPWLRFMCSGCSKRMITSNSSYEALPLRSRCFYCTRKVSTSMARRYGNLENRLCCYHIDMADEMSAQKLRKSQASSQLAESACHLRLPPSQGAGCGAWGEGACSKSSAPSLADRSLEAGKHMLRPYTKQKPRAWQETKRARSLRHYSAIYYVRNREKVLARRRIRKAIHILQSSNSTVSSPQGMEALAKNLESKELKLVFCCCHAEGGERKGRMSSSMSEGELNQPAEDRTVNHQLSVTAGLFDRLQGYTECKWCLRYHHHMQRCQQVSMQQLLLGAESKQYAEDKEQLEFEREWSRRKQLLGLDFDFLSSLSS